MDPQQEPSDAYWYLTIDEVEAEIMRRVRLRGCDAYNEGFFSGCISSTCTILFVLIAAEVLRIVSDNKLPAF